MHQLTNWFQRQGAKDKRAVFLEDALFDGRFAAYAYYRMRFYIGRSLLAAGLHITEVVFLSFIFAPRALATALIVRTATGFALGWWWGALEVMREDIRRMRRGRKSRLIARTLPQWLGLSIVASVLVISCFVGWIVYDVLVARRPFDVFHFYVFANGLRLAGALFARAFHSGVYALRRVYRPLWSLVLVDLMMFYGTLLLWPLAGKWSVPSMLVVSILLSNALTFHFTRPVYRFLALFDGPIQVKWPTFAFLRRSLATKRFFLGGCSYALIKLDSILLFVLFAGMRDRAGYETLLLFYVVGPFLRAATDWAQLYYFDLKRLELEAFTNLKRTFDRGLNTLSGIAGVVCWALAAVCGTLFLQKNLGILYLVMAGLILIRSRLAFLQIRAFAENRWNALLASGLFVLAGALACRAFLDNAVVRAECFSVMLLPALFVLHRREPPIALRRDDSEVLVPLEWLGILQTTRDPVRVRCLRVSIKADDWGIEHLARSLARRLRNRSGVTLLGGKRILWWEPATARPKSSDDWIWRRGAGMIESLRSTAYEEDGRAALRRAEAEGLLGSVNRLPAAAGEAVDGSQSIKELFHEMFPDGGIFEPGANGGRMLGSFSSTDRRDIMHGVVRYSRNFFQIVRSGKYDVTALLQRNEIALVFIVDKAVNKKARRIWRGLIGSYNLGLAIDRGPAEGATERNGRRVERMTTIGLALHNVEDNSDRAQLVTQ